MQTYFTSDLHFGHKNIIKFCNRPFKDVDEMNYELVRKYNNVVKPEDTCYFLGDLGKLRFEDFRDVINSMNGNKIMVLGNHDKGTLSFLNLGFQAVMLNGCMIVENKFLTFSHYPLIGVKREDTSMYKGREHENWYREDITKKLGYGVSDFGQFHVHGHLHAPNSGRAKVIEGRQMDIGVDGNNYMPVSLGKISKIMRKVLS